jgi:GTP-binding protein HflX
LLIEEVNKVLADSGADHIPALMVYNKVDLLDDKFAGVERDDQGKPIRVWVSARTGAGVDALLAAIAELIGGDMMSTALTLTPVQGRQRARLYKQGVVKGESTLENGDVVIRLHMPRADLLRLIAEEQLDPAAFDPGPHTDLPVPGEDPGMTQVDEAG